MRFHMEIDDSMEVFDRDGMFLELARMSATDKDREVEVEVDWEDGIGDSCSVVVRGTVASVAAVVGGLRLGG